MRFTILFMICTFVGIWSLQAQLPLRNYIYLGKDSILALLDAEKMEYEVISDENTDDSYGYDYDWEDEEVYYEDYGEEEQSVQDEELGTTGEVYSEVPDPELEAWLKAQKDSLSTEAVATEEEMAPEEISIEVYSNEEFGYTGNMVTFHLRNDSCYLIQYEWYNDEFVLGSIRNVMEKREDFSSCFDLKDCWVQQKEDDAISYYWNLFDKYEGEDYWKVLRIEAEKEFEENRWWYQFAEGKF